MKFKVRVRRYRITRVYKRSLGYFLIGVDNAMCDNEEDATNYPPEFHHSLTPSGMPPHILNLKAGAMVMLLRNLNIKEGLCNGTRLMVKRLHHHVMDADMLLGPHKSKQVLIPRLVLAPHHLKLIYHLCFAVVNFYCAWHGPWLSTRLGVKHLRKWASTLKSLCSLIDSYTCTWHFQGLEHYQMFEYISIQHHVREEMITHGLQTSCSKKYFDS